MPMHQCRWPACFAAGLLLLFLAGCGPKTVTVTGRIMKGGEPMKVSEDTYVTLSFIPDPKPPDSQTSSYTAKFDQKSGTYRVQLPAGSYRTKLVIAYPAKPGELNAPRPIDSDKAYELKRDQELDVEVPATRK